MTIGGCDHLEPGGALVYVFSTHHATPENGIIPDRGDHDEPRVFDNDEGWTIRLHESYITTSAVTLLRCDGAQFPLTMFWGPCPEDLRERDLELLTVAGLKVPPGNYCGLQVTYAPYEEPVVETDGNESRHVAPTNEAVYGATIYLRGLASKDDQEVPFELVSDRTAVAQLDLSQLEGPGQPMNVAHREYFPKELTVVKTYDRFFDGVDFATMDTEAVESTLHTILVGETRVVQGTVVQAAPSDN